MRNPWGFEPAEILDFVDLHVNTSIILLTDKYQIPQLLDFVSEESVKISGKLLVVTKRAERFLCMPVPSDSYASRCTILSSQIIIFLKN